jgi:hypothetical protein
MAVGRGVGWDHFGSNFEFSLKGKKCMIVNLDQEKNFLLSLSSTSLFTQLADQTIITIVYISF